MTISEKGLQMIARFEGLRLNAYLCPKKKWTIGYGNTFYEDGRPVKSGDRLSGKEEAFRLLKVIAKQFEDGVNKNTTGVKLTQNQFDSLVSFSYNVGNGALAKSTMLKLIKKDPYDPKIRTEFMKWTSGNLPGLIIRREFESDNYFKAET